MKKIVIVCGLIAGFVVTAMTVISIAISYGSSNYHGSMLVGYVTMLLAFSLIFVGIKNYRDKHAAGAISFGKAFKIGLYITLVASTVYVIGWLIDYYLFVPDYMEKYASHELNQLKVTGASQIEIDKKVTEMAGFKEMYKNPLWIVLLTYAEILPVGLVVTIISALLLKRKPSNQTEPKL